jgi:uncharacterized RDD family membrane protein YckC
MKTLKVIFVTLVVWMAILIAFLVIPAVIIGIFYLGAKIDPESPLSLTPLFLGLVLTFSQAVVGFGVLLAASESKQIVDDILSHKPLW